jgi:hypothetical protein
MILIVYDLNAKFFIRCSLIKLSVEALTRIPLLIIKTTAKRDLTFIRGFVAWASDKKKENSPPLRLL